MPKKPTLPEPELHAMIERSARVRIGCKDFAPQFSLYKVAPDPHAQWPANWALWRVENVREWAPDCAEAFVEALERARMKWDVAWPRWND